MRKNHCRFDFPRPLTEKTRVIVNVIYHKRGEHKNTIKHCEVKLQCATNDRWLNSHMRDALKHWGGNVDFSLLIDARQVFNYVAKYVSKLEQPSTALQKIFQTIFRDESQINAGEVSAPKLIRRVFNKVASSRDKSIMEIHHLLSSTPYVQCSHGFLKVNFLSNLRRVRLESVPTDPNFQREEMAGDVGASNPNDAPAIAKSIVDLYGERLNIHAWKDVQEFARNNINDELGVMNFNSFVIKFLCTKLNKIAARENNKKLIPSFSPTFNSDAAGKNYYKYCWIQLLKFKPWNGYQESLLPDETSARLEITNNLNSLEDSIRRRIIQQWEQFSINNNVAAFDAQMREVEDDIRNDDDLYEDEQPFAVHEQQPQYAELYQAMGNNPLVNDNENADAFRHIRWDMDADFTTPVHNYEQGEFCKEHVDEKWTSVSQDAAVGIHENEFNNYSLERLRPEQAEPAKAFLSILGLLKSQHDNSFLPSFNPLDAENPSRNVMTLIGPAGSGKSTTILSLVGEIIRRANEKYPALQQKARVLLLAPTGRAALNISGVTLQSREGLRIPLRNINSGDEHTIKGESLTEFQKNFENVVAVVVDEYSMISNSMLYWIHKRLIQASPGRKTYLQPSVDVQANFAGVPLLLCGDPGQIPPVGGLFVWENRSTSAKKPVTGVPLLGYNIYKSITNVFCLREIARQDNQFEGQLILAIRDGTTTMEQFQYITDHCLQSNKTQQQLEAHSGLDSLSIFNTNEEADNHNCKMLEKTGQPVLFIEAAHDADPQSIKKASEQTRNLKPRLYLSRNSKVMLLWNKKCGLVNGSTGIVRDFLYEPNTTAPHLPYAIVIEFDDYKGPPFFSGEDKKKFVPILAENYEWTDIKRNANQTHFRKTFPITLAWGLTVWKTQGITIYCPINFDLGDRQKDEGTTYVGFSRCKYLQSLNINAGFTLLYFL